MRWMRCCLNPKVVGGLAAVGVVAWLIVPAAGVAAVPLLLGLVCPLSMGVMGWQMWRQGSRPTPTLTAADSGPATTPAATSDVDAEIRALREEIAVERARQRLTASDDQPAT